MYQYMYNMMRYMGFGYGYGGFGIASGITTLLVWAILVLVIIALYRHINKK